MASNDETVGFPLMELEEVFLDYEEALSEMYLQDSSSGESLSSHNHSEGSVHSETDEFHSVYPNVPIYPRRHIDETHDDLVKMLEKVLGLQRLREVEALSICECGPRPSSPHINILFEMFGSFLKKYESDKIRQERRKVDELRHYITSMEQERQLENNLEVSGLAQHQSNIADMTMKLKDQESVIQGMDTYIRNLHREIAELERQIRVLKGLETGHKINTETDPKLQDQPSLEDMVRADLFEPVCESP
ncbi:hypothetical protein HYFRA_00003613 [Hymenoscyphus fraxineus]|uniref:Uncharacterized protein n=1 Tax=Hymenoscyphus fraxineus TaxID=746836 RepID=A0A9N9L134_9HELO|nr:hypothetical protein HYFRA_00003613 [Hymenoscyphus fraxineus]